MHGDTFTTITQDEHHRLLRADRDCEALRSALRVIRTWAAFDCDETSPSHAIALNARHVLELADKALGRTQE